MKGRYAGIDIGGTSVKWIVVTDAGLIIDEGSQPTNKDAIVEQSVRICCALKAAHSCLCGIGIISPGQVDEERGIIVYAANLALDNANLAQTIYEKTSIPVVVGHDGRSAGLAEGILGAGRGARSFAMIPIGTGISAAIYTGMHMLQGAQYSAGEIGHSPVNFGGEKCNCGQKGCLEVYASAKGIARQYALRTGNDIGTQAIEKKLGIDPDADYVWDQAIQTMGLALAQLTFTVDPERIIIGGGLSKAGALYIDPLRDVVKSHLTWRSTPEIVVAQLGDQAGRWGAAILACQKSGNDNYLKWSVT